MTSWLRFHLTLSLPLSSSSGAQEEAMEHLADLIGSKLSLVGQGPTVPSPHQKHIEASDLIIDLVSSSSEGEECGSDGRRQPQGRPAPVPPVLTKISRRAERGIRGLFEFGTGSSAAEDKDDSSTAPSPRKAVTARPKGILTFVDASALPPTNSPPRGGPKVKGYTIGSGSGPVSGPATGLPQGPRRLLTPTHPSSPRRRHPSASPTRDVIPPSPLPIRIPTLPSPNSK